MSSQQPLSDDYYHKQRRSLLRKKTRAGWGVGISSAMTAGGLYYMAAPAAVSAYGYHKSGGNLDDLEQIMAQRGIKPRSRDRLASFLIGTTEKAMISALTLGHSEALFLDGCTGQSFTEMNLHVEDHSASSGFNEVMNTPVDAAKQSMGYTEGDAFDPTVFAVVGGTAAAMEIATAKVGDAAANRRNQYQAGESQQAALQRMGVRR
ncbi:hypothetical protein SLS59_009912 [Nothophoma quercina]|uniref:Uncharacterized protein n=1 Tax=Nothophoma quercina TaxID=749835 RepID=A0ABR3QJ13_9PLEO